MTTPESILGTYQARLANDECYMGVSEATVSYLNHSVLRYNLQPFDRVAHGVLAFCIEEGAAACEPWIVAPDAPEKDIIGGRHGLVMNEFYGVAERHNLFSYVHKGVDLVDYDDFVRTYIVKDPANLAPVSVICEPLADSLANDGCLELISDLSHRLDEHQFLVGVSKDDGQPTTYMNIRAGTTQELTFGSIRGLFALETIAPEHDILGRVRELESYAQFAKRNGLDPLEFPILVRSAVEAFRNHRQVSLDTLCQEVLAERDLED